MNVETIAPLLLALAAIIGAAIAIAKFRRDDDSAVVDQQSKLLADMKLLVGEATASADRHRANAKVMKELVEQLTLSGEELRKQLRRAQRENERLEDALTECRAHLQLVDKDLGTGEAQA